MKYLPEIRISVAILATAFILVLVAGHRTDTTIPVAITTVGTLWGYVLGHLVGQAKGDGGEDK